MANTLLSYYLNQYAEGKLSEEEKVQFAEILRSPENRAELDRLLDNDWPFWESLRPELPETYDQLKQDVLRRIGEEKQPEAPVKRISFRRYRWVAASVLLVLAFGGMMMMTTDVGNTEIEVSEPRLVQTSIAPGKEGAVLTLADGTAVLLDTIQNGTVALQSGITAKVMNGRLVYEGGTDIVVFNTMSTPKGRQFQLTLPDGTRVWLNAASSIRYPTAFTEQERRVEMKGEAYFEVAKNNRPFIVQADGRAEITVLGTHFNVNSYENEEGIATTLLEGSVRVSKEGKSAVIRPGQQARVTEDIRVVEEVNTDQVVAWKNGLFNFEGLGLKEVMNQLERWYDIEVLYKGNVPDIHFWGGITKDVPLEDLLIGLKQSEVNFRIEGRKLIVLP